jgi:DNA-directed RNA polymerase subunit alpha
LKRVGEIVALSDADLLKIRNFGTTSLDELRAKLEELGITKSADTETESDE